MGSLQSASEIMINDYKERKGIMINDYKEHNNKRNRKGYSPDLAQAKAEYLCRKLKSPQSRNFYLKCAWNLTDMFIDNLLAISVNKEAPARYFAFVAAKEMRS